MIYCSSSRFIPTTTNMVTVEHEGMYYYVYLPLYEQAVVLSDSYGNDARLGDLMEMVGYNNMEDSEIVSYAEETLPKPLNILSYFLCLVDKCSEIPQDITQICGALHVMTSTVNFRNLVRQPKAVWAIGNWSLKVLDEYQLTWEKFFKESIPYNSQMFMMGVNAYFGNMQVQMNVNNNNDSYIIEEEEEEDDDPLAGITSDNFDWDDPDAVAKIASMYAGSSDEDEKEVVVKEEVKVDKPKSGLDLIRAKEKERR